MKNLHFSRYSGEAVAAIVPDLGQLRIAVFREFPYLYEGNMDYERDYLQTYVDSADSFVFLVHDGDRPVGATTCVPLSDEIPELREPFEQAGIDPRTVMYFGESILLPAYRGQGLGHRFFDERERFTSERQHYPLTAFCAVERPASHPLRPVNYHSNDAFWQTRGYDRHPELQCRFPWKDIGETQETEKLLTFYLRRWQ